MVCVPGSPQLETFVARQPIFDQRLEVYAYELLFRDGLENSFGAADVDLASTKVIADGSLLMDLHRLTSGRRAFINVSREVLLAGWARLLPAGSTVIELLESIDPDARVLEACHQLRRAGYRLALDDFVYSDRMEPLLAVANIVKVDFLATPPGERFALAQRLSGRPLQLLAEKLETPSAVAEARQLGFTLYQGYFFSHPVIVTSQDLPSYKHHLIELLREIHRADLDFEHLDQLIRSDMALCYRLLRYINAAHMGLRTRVESIHRALVLLGEREIRRWFSLVLVTVIGQDRPPELLRQAVIRARFCELLAPTLGLADRAGDLFLVGLFSLIDAVLGRPMEEILTPLPIAEELKQALGGDPRALGGVLDLCVAYERGHWERVQQFIAPGDEARVSRLYLEAVSWGTACALGPGESA